MPGLKPGGPSGEVMTQSTREAICTLLTDSPMTMSEIAAKLGKSKQTIAFHFYALRKDGFDIYEVSREPSVNKCGLGPVRYRLNRNPIPEVGAFNLADYWGAREVA